MLELAVECVAVRGDLGASSAIIRGTALSTTWESCRLRVTLFCWHSWSPEHSAVHDRWVQYGHLECLDRELSDMISSLWTAAGTVPNSLAAALSDLDAYLPPASYRARVWACRLLVVLWLILLSTMLFPLVSTSVCKPHVAVVLRGMHKTAGICTVEEARRSCS